MKVGVVRKWTRIGRITQSWREAAAPTRSDHLVTRIEGGNEHSAMIVGWTGRGALETSSEQKLTPPSSQTSFQQLRKTADTFFGADLHRETISLQDRGLRRRSAVDRTGSRRVAVWRCAAAAAPSPHTSFQQRRATANGGQPGLPNHREAWPQGPWLNHTEARPRAGPAIV